MRFQMIATRNGIWNPGISFYARERQGAGFGIAQPLVFTHYEQERITEDEPFLTLHPDDAQALMDSLWDCGLRPSEGSGSAGALAATQKHLEDMRKLVFKE